MPSLIGGVAHWATANCRRLWLTSFAFFFLLMACFSIATPLTAAPDEPAHITRAASVVRGQINGPDVSQTVVVAGIPRTEVVTGIRLPERFNSLNTMYQCYVYDATKSAACAKPFTGSDTEVSMTTAAGRYNPAYYLAIGWPTLLSQGTDAIYLMRLLSALICAALLASAVVTAGEWRRPGVAVLGVVTAATPMVLFLGGVVNPNAVECAAGILAWISVLTVFMQPDPRRLNRNLARAGIASCTLFCIRPLGLAWVLAAIVVGLLIAERGTLAQTVRRRVFWLWTGIAGIAFVFSEAWNMTHPDNSGLTSSMTAKAVALWSFNHSPRFVTQMIGNFGWLDTPAPTFAQLVWPGVIFALGLLAWSCARRLEALSIIAIAVGIFVLPILAGAMSAELGPIWQGRYLLAFAAGLPILCACIVAKHEPLGTDRRRGLVNSSMVLLVAANLVTFYWSERRYSVGSNGSLLIRHAHWQPPGTWTLWLLLYAVALAVQYGVVRALDRPRNEAPGRDSGPTQAEAPVGTPSGLPG